MFIIESVNSSDLIKLDACPNSGWIKIKFKNKEYHFGLLKTNIPYIKMFYLDYYKNSKFYDTKTGEIMDSFFG